MVFAHAYIVARIELCSALAQNNVSRNDSLSARFLDAKTASRPLLDEPPAFLCAMTLLHIVPVRARLKMIT